MNVSQLYRFSRNDSINNFVALADIKTVLDKERYKGTEYAITHTFDEFSEEYPAINAEKIFFCNGIHKIFYFDRQEYVLFPVPLYGKHVILTGEISFEEFVNSTAKNLGESIKNLEYEAAYWALSDRMRMEFTNLLIEDGKTEGLFNSFISAYVLSDYGCEAISHENMVKLFNSRAEEDILKSAQEKQEVLKKYPDPVTVYRGEASLSTPHNQGWSWTLDINVANFFATRFGLDDSRIIEAIVKKKDIETVLHDESECLINPTKINIVDVMHLYGRSWLEKNLNTYVTKLFHKYKEILTELYAKHGSHDLHDPLHTARVLLLALLLGRLYKLNHTEMNNLATAIVYHDIGRVDDGIDDMHGKRSADIFSGCKVPPSINKPLAAFLMEYHCLSDDKAHEFIKGNFNNDERVHLLFNIVKDADALDRVRFGKSGSGLNMAFLRLHESKKMTMVARLGLEGIKL